MQEEVEQRVISLCITGMRMTGDVLKVAVRKWLASKEQKKHEKRQVKVAGKSEKARLKVQKKVKQKEVPKGKQTLKQLMAQNVELKSIPITDDNIKDFDRIARKYGIDYSLKLDDTVKENPKYFVFFKARDVDVLTEAFKEYAGVTLKKKEKKEAMKKRMEQAKKKSKEKAKQRQRHRKRSKNREQSL